MSAWQPIATAPRDGGRIIVGYWHKGKWVLRIARLNTWDQWLTEPASWLISPTHWLPTDPPESKFDISESIRETDSVTAGQTTNKP